MEGTYSQFKTKDKKFKSINRNISGIIFDIKRFAIHDGPGIRSTIFLKGCPLRCWWCHNPESQSFEIQKFYTTNMTSETSQDLGEQIGEIVTVKDVLDEIIKDRIFYEESVGGVTFSGGEPLSQPEFLHSLLISCKDEGIHIAVDTSGYISTEKLLNIARYVDLFLYDLKFIDDSKHIKYTGSSNKILLKNLSMLADEKKEIFIRIPIIPTINNTDEEITSIARYISSLNHINKIDLLPYHRIGKEKYSRLQIPYKMENIPEPTQNQMEEIKEKLESYGFNVTIGG